MNEAGRTIESRLLLAAAEAALGMRPRDVPPLDGPVEAGLLRLSRQHGMTPLVYRFVRREAGPDHPVTQQLRADYLPMAVRAHRNADALGEVFDLLTSVGVEAVPLKGPWLAERLFEDVTMRQPGDLDLLVRRSALPAAVAALSGEGYRRMYDAAVEGERIMDGRGLELSRGDRHLELQWSFAHRDFGLSVDAEAALDRALAAWQAARGAGMDVAPVYPTLEFADEYAFLAVHGMKHLWFRLAWMVDVARMTLQNPSDEGWEALLRAARQQGIGRHVLLSACLTERLTGATLHPALAAAARRDRAAGRLADECMALLFAPPSPGRKWRRRLLPLTAYERRADRWPYLRQTLKLGVLPSERDAAAEPGTGPAGRFGALVRRMRRGFSVEGLRFLSFLLRAVGRTLGAAGRPRTDA